MKRSELATLERTLLGHRNDVLTRTVREMPARLERQLSVRATELSTEALGAVVERLKAFRQELSAAIAKLPEHARETARTQHKELEKALSAAVAKRLDDSLDRLTRDCRKALEAESGAAAGLFNAKLLEAETAFSRTLDALAKRYEAKRMELVKEFESKSVTPILAETFRGNWNAATLYRRGETFSFRGGWHLVLQDARGQLPGVKTLKGPAPVYALLAAPGAPGPAGANGTGTGGSNYVAPPLVDAGSTRGQWTFSSGYFYWAVADGSVKRWAVTTPP